MAYPGEEFRARITYVGASVDPAVRRLTVRAEISNPDGRLKPDMFASFRILTGVPTRSPSVPAGVFTLRAADGWSAPAPSLRSPASRAPPFSA